MVANTPRIVFMGTPEFAVASLGALIINNYPVAAIVTAPDKPAGRGQKLTWSTVKGYAKNTGIPILQPHNLKDPEFLDRLKKVDADLFVVVAFRKLPRDVWKIPPMGTINLHASLLPQYRGAAPVNHVLINGEQETGVTTFLINEEIDTGKILLQESILINPEENAGELHDRLMREGAKLLVRTLEELTAKTLRPKPQDAFLQGPLRKAPKIRPEECFIPWDRKCQEVFNFIRGLSPHPGARTYMNTPADQKILLKVFDADYILDEHQEKPGSMQSDGQHYLQVALGDGFLLLKTVQVEGRKRMKIEEFLRGFDPRGVKLSSL